MIEKAYIDKLADKLRELEASLANPALAATPKKFREATKDYARLRKVLDKAELYFRIKRDLEEQRALLQADDADPDLKALAEGEVAGLEQAFPPVEKELQEALLPPDPNDDCNVIVEIRAGTGGDEAGLFAGDLFRMYSRYCEGRGWTISVLDANPSSVGGYKEVVFSVAGAQVYRHLKYESGCHRVQRVPATEASGRIHTSAATVFVLPEVEDVDDVVIEEKDLRVDTYRSSGAGGQHVNKTDSAIRITHLPTGIVVACQAERSQHRNREKAMNMLKASILDAQRRQEEESSGTLRRSQIGSGDRSEKIRTYNFPQNRLTDHRINYTIYTLDRFMEGELDDLVLTLQKNDMELRIQKEMAASRG